jgi:hypothetical protein
MAAQLEALDNLETVLAAAAMSLANVVRRNAYTSDVDQLFGQWGTLAERLGNAEACFTTSVRQWARKPHPTQVRETAAQPLAADPPPAVARLQSRNHLDQFGPCPADGGVSAQTREQPRGRAGLGADSS